MLDIPSISAISAVVAAIGVIIGVVFAIMELRNLVKTRQTDLVMRLFSTFGSKEFQEAYQTIRTTELKDYNEFIKKHGMQDYVEVCSFFEGIGILWRRKLIDIGLVADMFGVSVKLTWEKVKPLVEGAREYYSQPRVFIDFEYLYNEMQKREQRLQQTQQ